LLVDDAGLGEAAFEAGQADEPELAADVVAPGGARRALPAHVVRLDGDPVAFRDAGDACADARHDARELMAHHDRDLGAGDRVWRALRWAEDRAFQVFVQVAAADAA